MGEIVVVQVAADHYPGTLGELLAARNRPVRIVRRDEDEALPTPGEVRALAVLGGATPDEDLRALAGRCAQGGLPVLAVGEGGAALLGGEPLPDAPRLAALRVREPADDVLGPVPEGQCFVAVARLPQPPTEAVVLAEFDAGPAAVRIGERGYALGFHPEYDGAWLADATDDEPLAERARAADRFLRAHGAALLGRWLDQVVGRTEEETPWGRRGPGSVPGPGRYLNPA